MGIYTRHEYTHTHTHTHTHTVSVWKPKLRGNSLSRLVLRNHVEVWFVFTHADTRDFASVQYRDNIEYLLI